jgi:thiol-disulfide isomerase/thioredoxin
MPLPETHRPRATVIKVLGPILLVIAIAIGGLLFVKAHLTGDGADNSSSNQQASAPVSPGTVVPDFSMTSAQGKSAIFSDVAREAKAKVILMNFWATWCEACMVEMPSIVELQTAYKGKGLQVIGINLDENPGSVVPRAEKELGISFPVFSDADGKITDYFDVHAIPLSVVLGSDRKILYIENGERNWNDQDIHEKMDGWLGMASK